MKKNKLNIWVISDSHFYHYNIIRYCGRQFKSEKEMNFKMIKRWNSRVKKNDLVLFLGDFALHRNSAQVSEICEQLKGRKILVRGNHDRKGHYWYLNNGFDFICDQFTLGNIIFTHRPIKKDDFLSMSFKLNVHGHIHQKEVKDKKIYKNVSAEKINYLPINLDSILKEFRIRIPKRT